MQNHLKAAYVHLYKMLLMVFLDMFLRHLLGALHQYINYEMFAACLSLNWMFHLCFTLEKLERVKIETLLY